MLIRQIELQEFERAYQFVNRIGIKLRFSHETPSSFLPGVWISNEQMYCNPSQLLCIGDLLHEAGHFAVTPSELRHAWSIEGFDFSCISQIPVLLKNGAENPLYRKLIDGDEQAAIAWSYAAASDIDIDLHSIHLDSDFDGEWEPTVLALQLKCHAGINNLQNTEMSTNLLFPKMLRWLQI